MCGLVGFLNSRLTDQKSIISNMCSSLNHRGPNDQGVWHDPEKNIGLGHRRLAIIDLSAAGHQPMESHSRRYVMVYNGEIYNAHALKKSLYDYPFRGQTDTEILLAYIEAFGLEQALQNSTGMFAFALWDKQEQILHLARDRLGEKPLYYGLINDTFIFASELKAIRAYPHFQNSINRSSVSLLMQYGYIPAPQSIYDDIYKLMPGTYLSITQTQLPLLPHPKIYWSALQIAETGLTQPLAWSDAEAIEEVHSMLKTIVKQRMVSDVPIGTFLSGGIDSSLITALMQTQSNQPIKTFTIGFHDKHHNEAHYAKAIAGHLNTDHAEYYIQASDALDIIPKLAHIYDEPFADSSAIPTYFISKYARQSVSVCLSGDGGDELFGGYNRYVFAKTLWQKMSLLPYPMRRMLQKLLLAFASPRMTPSTLSNKLHKLSTLLSAQTSAAVYQHLISQWDMSIVKTNSVIHPLLYSLETMNFIESMMLTDTLTYLPDDIMVKVDRAAMAVSLENRAPFLDHHLFETIWRLPIHMKIRNRDSKWLLREILSQYIPRHLYERPKMGFGIPLADWLRGPLRDWANDLLNQTTIEQQGLLQSQPILKKWHEHLAGKRNWQYPLWTVLMFQTWFKEHHI